MPESDKYTIPPRAGSSTAGARRRNAWRVAGITLGVIGCLVFMLGGTMFGYLYWGNTNIRDIVNGHGWSTLKNTVLYRDPTLDWTPAKVWPDKDSLNVLVMGSDHDYDNRDRIIPGSFGRSDSIMVAHVDFRNKTIYGLTIPRDTAVHIPGRSGIHKINAAHSYGGPPLSAETVQSVFGIPVDAYVDLDLEGFQKVVNTLGGIDVNVEVPRGHKGLDYDDNWGNLHIHLKPGYQHLNGYQAMGYVRMRHSDSDEMRSKRQHEFLEALRDKVKQPATFLKVSELIKTINQNVRRNMNDDQLLTLINFARTLPAGSVQMATLPSEEGPAYVTIDSEKSAELIQRMFFPNQQVALNIDAPDPSAVASMNAPYERGGHHRRASRHSRRRGHTRAATAAPRATGEAHDLAVEPPAADSAPAPSSEPSGSSDGDSGGGSGGQTGNPQ